MPSAYICRAVTLGPFNELSGEQRQELGAHLPKASLRRMSDLGLLIGAVLHALDAREDCPLILASTYAESRALEAFLDSFPTPSPTRFQTSVHPSSVQQPRVALQAPLAQFIPMTGKSGLAVNACRTALSVGDSDALLIGGDERGNRLIDNSLAHDVSFAFGLELSTFDDGAIGQISWDAKDNPGGDDLALYALFEAVAERRPVRVANRDLGVLRIEWR